MSSKETLATYFNQVKEVISQLDIEAINSLADALMHCYENGKQVFIFGNGGSGATASHVAGDFIKGVSYGLDKRFRFICLNDNSSAFAAIANDLGYDYVFVEQLKNFINEGDLVIGLSGSGNSVNVVKAFEYAASCKAKTVAFCGYKGGKIKQMADYVVHIPVSDMEQTEDLHLMVFHALKSALTRRLRGDHFSMGDQYDKRVEC